MRPHIGEVAIINQHLLKHGKMLNGKPVFRVIFSDDLTEKRVGVFNKFHGNIWVGRSSGVQLVPKYGYIQSAWVLEKYSVAPNAEILDYDHYEPVYAFRDKDNNYLEPLLRVCEIIIYGILQPNFLTPEQELAKIEEKEKKRIEHDRLVLEEKRPDFMVLKELGELVQVPSKQFKKTPVRKIKENYGNQKSAR